MAITRWLQRSGAAALLAVTLAALSSTAAGYSQLIVFGDSTVDSGYYRALADPGASGATFSSLWSAAVAAGAGVPTSSPGRMYPQVLASYLGLSANPANQAGGSNYATSGAKNVDVNTTANGGFRAAVPTVTQIANYLSAQGNRADPNALYLISSGGNDTSFAAGQTGSGPYPGDPTAYVTSRASSLALAIASLKTAGARSIVVAGQPASFPLNDAAQRQLKAAANQALFTGLASQGVTVIQADIDSVRLSIYNNPAQYGFTTVSNAAGSTACVAPSGVTSAWGLLCSASPGAPAPFATPTADLTRLFADDQHLATAGQKIIADYIFALLNRNSSDCLFNWAEQNYAALFPAPGASATSGAYYYRYYAATNAYLGTSSANNHLYYLSNAGLQDGGPMANWFTTSACQ